MTSQQGKFHFLKDQSVNMFDVEIHLDSYVCSRYISNYFWLTKYQLFYIKSVRICLVKYQSCFYKKYLKKKVMQVHCCLSEVVSYRLAFDHDYSMATFLKILVLGISHLPMTTLKRTISDSYKHLRMTKALLSGG